MQYILAAGLGWSLSWNIFSEVPDLVVSSAALPELAKVARLGYLMPVLYHSKKVNRIYSLSSVSLLFSTGTLGGPTQFQPNYMSNL